MRADEPRETGNVSHAASPRESVEIETVTIGFTISRPRFPCTLPDFRICVNGQLQIPKRRLDRLDFMWVPVYGDRRAPLFTQPINAGQRRVKGERARSVLDGQKESNAPVCVYHR